MARRAAIPTTPDTPPTGTAKTLSPIAPLPTWLEVFSPQAHTVPSARRASPCKAPADTVLTPPRAPVELRTWVGKGSTPSTPLPNWP